MIEHAIALIGGDQGAHLHAPLETRSHDDRVHALDKGCGELVDNAGIDIDALYRHAQLTRIRKARALGDFD